MNYRTVLESCTHHNKTMHNYYSPECTRVHRIAIKHTLRAPALGADGALQRQHLPVPSVLCIIPSSVVRCHGNRSCSGTGRSDLGMAPPADLRGKARNARRQATRQAGARERATHAHRSHAGIHACRTENQRRCGALDNIAPR